MDMHKHVTKDFLMIEEVEPKLEPKINKILTFLKQPFPVSPKHLNFVYGDEIFLTIVAVNSICISNHNTRYVLT